MVDIIARLGVVKISSEEVPHKKNLIVQRWNSHEECVFSHFYHNRLHKFVIKPQRKSSSYSWMINRLHLQWALNSSVKPNRKIRVILTRLTIIMSCSSSWEPKLRVDECQLDFNSAQTAPQANKPQLWPQPPPPAPSQSVTRRRSSGSGFVRPLLPRRRHWRLWSKVVAHDGRCARWRRPHCAYI